MGFGKGGARRSNKKQHVMAGLLASSALVLTATPAMAQDADPDEESASGGDIVVTGIRGTIQSSIAEKRDNDLIVEVLTSDEIGDLPALSIGEALETLTGAASHREQGGATEIALRGLGPFLSSTTINGRIATNGSGDRSVNFSQFPSELFNTIAIYKTQSASLIEGGVAGQIALETVAPLDYGRQRIQADFKLPYNPQNFDIDESQRERDFGHRITLSYVDQYDLGGLGDLGISLGYQTNRSTNPEQEANVSNTIRACVLDPTDTGDGVFDDGNCDTNGSTIDGLRDGSVTDPFVIARNSYAYRHNITDDQRDSFFAALQYRPSPTFEINADFQYANRFYTESRSDLGFVEGRRIDGPGDPNRIDLDLLFTETGALRQFTSEQRIEATSEYLQRNEDYYGGGIDIELEVSDRLTLTADVSYSETSRIEEAVQIRFRTEDDEDIFGNTGAWVPSLESDGSTQDDRVETAVQIFQNGSETLNLLTQNFDVNNYDLFANDPRLRADLEQDRFNSIWAVRADAEYEMDGFLSSIMVGARYQDLLYQDVPGAQNGTSRFENTYNDTSDTGALATANRECRTSFPSTGFLGSLTNGNPLFTNLDASGNVIGTSNTFATFDALCIAQVLEREDPSGLSFDNDGVPIFPTGEFDSIQNSDVTEQSWAGYIQANFNHDLGATPIRGNFGVRVVHTEVESTGFRTTINSVIDNSDPLAPTVTLVEDATNLTTVTGGGSYTEFLPSFNLTAEFTPDLLGRVGVYRALSRPDPSELGFGRSFSIDDSEEFATVAEALGTVTGIGNPFTDPLLSWNADLSLEWYPNEDTILAGTVYYKSFNGGFDAVGQTETFNIDGQDVDALVRTVDTSDDTSTIYGLELSVAHRLSYLPAPLDGLGFKVGYNYANSDFEFQDDTLGAITTVLDDGTTTTSNGLIAPADIFGLSEHVLSAQVYYQIGDLDLQGVYKYRSDYFQQFVATPGRIRYVDDVGVFEARISYRLTSNVTLRLEGINLFNEPRFDYRGAPDDFASSSLYGPRYYASVRFKF